MLMKMPNKRLKRKRVRNQMSKIQEQQQATLLLVMKKTKKPHNLKKLWKLNDRKMQYLCKDLKVNTEV